MKVRVTLELDLPDHPNDEPVDLQAEYVPGITWELAFVIQSLFDNFLNFAICQHLHMVTKWLGRKDAAGKLIVKSHRQWADILRKAEKTMKVEKIS